MNGVATPTSGWVDDVSTDFALSFINSNVPPPYRTNIAANSETAKREYHRCLTAVDADIGRLLDRLDQLGISTNTMLIFLGDNGFYLGEHGLGDKRSVYEESLHVPMLVRHPPSHHPTGSAR